ncbi:MAG TPA: SHOCT domain-containing protein [Mycobacterium sp.]|nr:SHOCT domain-containing protein [Mycobacterium sp.]
MRKTVIIGSVVGLVVSVVGFITALVLNAFVLDDYNAYGEVPIPATRTLHLPAGDTSISFHTVIVGRSGGLPVPELDLSIDPPPGVAQPKVDEKFGSTTTVNNDAHRQVWVAHIPKAGDYTVRTDGKVTPFINPRLAFGHGSQFGYLPWVFAGLFAVSLAALLASALLWRGKPLPSQSIPVGAPGFTPVDLSAPTDEGIRLQELNTLKSLHESGALTDEEFEAEKRRVLGQ